MTPVFLKSRLQNLYFQVPNLIRIHGEPTYPQLNFFKIKSGRMHHQYKAISAEEYTAIQDSLAARKTMKKYHQKHHTRYLWCQYHCAFQQKQQSAKLNVHKLISRRHVSYIERKLTLRRHSPSKLWPRQGKHTFKRQRIKSQRASQSISARLSNIHLRIMARYGKQCSINRSKASRQFSTR